MYVGPKGTASFHGPPHTLALGKRVDTTEDGGIHHLPSGKPRLDASKVEQRICLMTEITNGVNLRPTDIVGTEPAKK